MDVYKIGVEIALAGSIESQLGAIGKQFLGLQGQVDKIGTSIAKWGTAIQGVVAIAASAAIFGGLKDLVERGSELIHVQQQLAATGVSTADQTKAQGEAWRIAAKYGLEVQNVLADIKEAQMVFGSTGHAIDFIDPLEKMRVVLNAVSEGRGSSAADAVYQMARAGELKGLQTPDQFVSYFDAMTKAITASGGKVDPRGFLTATQYGRIASKGWDEEFYTTYLPSMIQEMGPSQAGTALMSLFGTLVQGKASKRATQQLVDLGVIADPSRIIYNKLGDPVGFNPGAVANTEGLVKDPFKWAQTTLDPLLRKRFGDFQPGDERVIEALGSMFGNRTSAQAIAALTMEGRRINKDAGLIGQAQGLNAVGGFLANDPNTVMKNFSSSWNNMMTAFGAPMVAPALSMMNSFANAMKSITAVAAAHPDAVRQIGEMAGGLGAILGVLGAYKLGSAAYSIASGGGLMGSAAALDTSAAMLQEAAVALGAKGIGGAGGAGGVGVAGAAAGGSLFGGLWRMMGLASLPSIADWATDFSIDPSHPDARRDAARAQFGSVWNLLKPDFHRSSLTPSEKAVGGAFGHGRNDVPTIQQQSQAQVTVNIDGKALAKYVTDMVMKTVSTLIPHPTGAPIASGANSAPPVDSGYFGSY